MSSDESDSYTPCTSRTQSPLFTPTIPAVHLSQSGPARNHGEDGLIIRALPTFLPTVDSECSMHGESTVSLDSLDFSPLLKVSFAEDTGLRQGTPPDEEHKGTRFILGARASRITVAGRQTRMSAAMADEDDCPTCAEQGPADAHSSEMDRSESCDDALATESLGGPGMNSTSANAVPHQEAFHSESTDPGVRSFVATQCTLAAPLVSIGTPPPSNRPAPVQVDNLDTVHTPDDPMSSVLPSVRPRSAHGRRALARLGFTPREQALPFGGSTRPRTPKHRPHSRVWLRSYFTKTPLWFPEYFNKKCLSDLGIHLDVDGEKTLDLMAAREADSALKRR